MTTHEDEGVEDLDAPMSAETEGQLRELRISDVASGRERADEGRELILAAGRRVMRPTAEGELMEVYMEHLVFAGMMTRLQSFHEAAVTACESGNPHAAFTLIRAQAEQCAAIIYALDHPAKAERLWKDPDGHGVKVGRMTNHAGTSGRIPDFQRLYNQLSQYAHPSQVAHFAGVRVNRATREISWSSAPRFKYDHEVLVAFAWIVQLAGIGAELLDQLGQAFDLHPPKA